MGQSLQNSISLARQSFRENPILEVFDRRKVKIELITAPNQLILFHSRWDGTSSFQVFKRQLPGRGDASENRYGYGITGTALILSVKTSSAPVLARRIYSANCSAIVVLHDWKSRDACHTSRPISSPPGESVSPCSHY